ncbi:MAG TPA: hypothetical protein DDX98_04500 [Bacteroidales bacterium]|jgi:ABC-type Fe3+-siderophore transport system permease subunit|nr:hypothetical protein [Bacteroidales bacterium]
MSEEIIPIVIVPLFFAAVVLSFYFYFRARNKERMAMIEKGIYSIEFKKSNNGVLRWSLLLIGFAIGLLFGMIIESTTQLDEEVAYFSMIFLFGGLGLLASYIIEQKKKASE